MPILIGLANKLRHHGFLETPGSVAGNAVCGPERGEINRVLAKHYGFTEEELDFILHYDIKYRMGGDTGEEGE